MVHICRSSTGEVEAGEGPWGHTSSQSTLPGSCGLKTEAQGCLSSGLHTHAYMCGRAHTQHEKGFRSNWRRQSEHSATREEFTYFQRCVLIWLVACSESCSQKEMSKFPYWTNPLLVEQIPHWSQINKTPYWFWIHRDLISRVASGPILKLWVRAPGQYRSGQASREDRERGQKEETESWMAWRGHSWSWN